MPSENPWLDSLSEDWVSRAGTIPKSVHVNSAGSRIPRLASSGTSSFRSSTRSSENSIRRPSDRRKSALSERSLSADNILSNSISGDTDAKTTQIHIKPRSVSAASEGSVIRHGDTVDHRPANASPGKQLDQETPEWRRRLLKGNMGYGDQKDLFGPMGLENIFQKPREPQDDQGQQEKKGLSFLKGLDAMPSSPPPWPSAILQPPSPADNTQRHSGQNLERVDEDEERSDLGLDDDDPDAADLPLASEEGQTQTPSYGLDGSRLQLSVEKKSRGNTLTVPQPSTRPGLNGLFGSERSTTSSNQQATSMDGSRAVSGQTELRNEGFSPVSMSDLNAGPSHPNESDHVLQPKDLDRRLRDIADQRGNESMVSNSKTNDTSETRPSEIQEESLPIDLPHGTPDAPHLGDFVNVRRGGYSTDSSFMRKPLSMVDDARTEPPNGTVQRKTRTNRQSSELSQEELPPAPTPPNPVTPSRRQESGRDSQDRTRSSGSPLKLFGDHDTFTSNKLYRRMSQLEEPSELDRNVFGHSRSGSPDKRPSRERRAEPRLSSVEEGRPRCLSHGSNFGHGEMNDLGFSFTVYNHDEPPSDPSMSPASDAMPPGAQSPLRFRLDVPAETKDTFRGKRKSSRQSILSAASGQNMSSLRIRKSPRLNSREWNQSRNRDESMSMVDLAKLAEGKRPPTSPYKDPTPKRRRTEQFMEIEDNMAEVAEHVKDTHEKIQAVIGKRRDARSESSNNVAGPDVIARRHILRPRNPTPNQRRETHLDQQIKDAADAYLSSSPKLEAIKEHLSSPGRGNDSTDAQAMAVAGKIAAFAIESKKDMEDHSRKKSVTTQDFLDEAQKIMEYIRNKGKPTSGLASLQESDSEAQGLGLGEVSNVDPVDLSFERPASREGPRWRDPAAPPQITDPRVASQLRKFKESEDDDFMASSFRSLHTDQEAPAPAEEPARPGREGGIHIIENPRAAEIPVRTQEDGKTGGPPIHSQSDKTNQTLGSQASSLGRTVSTNASRKSDQVATLGPQAVAHLIPENVAGMTFDKARNAWVKSPKKSAGPAEISHLTESEDDPFREIPDLTVDEIKELNLIQPGRGSNFVQNLRASQHGRQTTAPSQRPHPLDTTADQNNTRPRTRDGAEPPPVSTSSVPSKFSHNGFGSSRSEAVETRATSWSVDPNLGRSKASRASQFRPGAARIEEAHFEDLEQELSFDDPHQVQNAGHTPWHPRNVAVSFSSPWVPSPARISLKAEEQTSRIVEEDASDEETNLSHFAQSSSTVYRKNIFQTTTQRKPSCLKVRPVPRIEEQNELSMMTPKSDHKQQDFAVSLSALRPAEDPDMSALVPQSSPNRAGDLTFFFSELPSFTVNQIDERELPDRVVAKRQGTSADMETENRFNLGIMELVKALQDAAPDEPYWENLRDVDLKGNNLESLHMLDEFCDRVEFLDVSNNQLAQLVGAPGSIRSLNVAHNSLTGLTGWGHLLNLQYLDVSHNAIGSLEGLNCLYHLRELNADGNKIDDLEGVLDLDGLLSLSIKGNRLKRVDFRETNLRRLGRLDLAGNQISEVHGLDWLPELESLCLDDNELEAFSSGQTSVTSNPKLKHLRLSQNRLQDVQLKDDFPSLVEVYLDRNQQPTISGLADLHHLELLSLREQEPTSTSADYTNYLENPEVHTLNLSATPLTQFELPSPFLNLRHLELASCGLESLPDQFGSRAPNLRFLNLNFNALKELRPLLGIKQLTTLHLAGNRIGRLRKSAAVLSRFTSLVSLDMRDNPLTVGFYAPEVEQRTRSLVKKPTLQEMEEALNSEPYTLPRADGDVDSQYAGRLDDGTSLRRKVFEVLLATRCSKLKSVDGLDFDLEYALRQDRVWKRLVELEVIRENGEANLMESKA